MAGTFDQCFHSVPLTEPCEKCPAGIREIFTMNQLTGYMSRHTLPDKSAEEQPAPANEPRAIIRAFALLGMERKLAANDGVKGGWRASKHQADEMRWKALQHVKALREEVDELADAVIRMDSLRREANAEQVQNILMEAADVALYALFVADVVGALPPTDERGR